MSLPIMAATLCIPLLSFYIPVIGLETTIMQTNLGFLLSSIILSMSICTNDVKVFIAGVVVGDFLFKLCFYAHEVTKGVLLLKYSTVKDRERNLGIIHAMQGLGTILSPTVVSSCLFYMDVKAPFMLTSVIMLLATPIISARLNRFAQGFNAEALLL